jgi:tRNA U34 5-carboxymethylaminomethyl modifying enzyme MnmG/GidA
MGRELTEKRPLSKKILIERPRRHASRPIPEGFDYGGVRHLRAEAREQLARIRPRTLGQAGCVGGITPADLALVLVHLEGRESPRDAMTPRSAFP